MSENITILEGGQAKVFGHVQKLKIINSGGGSSLWVSEDAVPTGSLYVNENGTYYASNDGYFGYDEVEVNIIKSVKGEKDGKPYDVTVDDDGFLEETELPAYIEVTTPPTTLNYVDGQDISTEGWVVKAFYADGTEWGDISDACTINPTKADASQTGERTATSDLDTNWTQPIVLYGRAVLVLEGSGYNGKYTYENIYEPYNGSALLLRQLSANRVRFAFASSTPGIIGKHTARITYLDPSQGGTDTERISFIESSHSVTIDGKTAYSHTGDDNYGSFTPISRFPEDVPTKSDDADNRTIWTAVYGTISPSGAQEITVLWEREDLEELTTTFNIIVGQGPIPPSPENNGGGGR